MNYSQKIYELRRKEDVSQEALAALIGTTRQQVSRWECGVAIPNPKFAYAIASHFGIDLRSDNRVLYEVVVLEYGFSDAFRMLEAKKGNIIVKANVSRIIQPSDKCGFRFLLDHRF